MNDLRTGEQIQRDSLERLDRMTRRVQALPVGAGRTTQLWLTTRIWCLRHPGLVSEIVIPEGVFTVTFTPKKS